MSFEEWIKDLKSKHFDKDINCVDFKKKLLSALDERNVKVNILNVLYEDHIKIDNDEDDYAVISVAYTFNGSTIAEQELAFSQLAKGKETNNPILFHKDTILSSSLTYGDYLTRIVNDIIGSYNEQEKTDKE